MNWVRKRPSVGMPLAWLMSTQREKLGPWNIDPWEAVIIGSGNDITEPEFALRYYEVTTWVDGKQIKRERLSFYDSSHVHYFEKNENGWTEIEVKKHLFDHCPLFGLPNNDEFMGDAEKVLSLIDAYDRTLSDASNEIEQLRLAYLIFKGMEPMMRLLRILKNTEYFSSLATTMT
ncbi:phage portal protein [Bacillus sp. SL00103]